MHRIHVLAGIAFLSTMGCSGGDDGGRGGGNSSSDGGSSSSQTGSGTAVEDGHPAWLAGLSWTKGYKIENNIPFESEDKGVKLGDAPDYDFEKKIGKSWVKSGTWKVASGALVIDGESVPLSTALSASCRILEMSFGTLSGSTVDACPTAKPPTSAECAKVGTYTKSSGSGSSGSGSSFEQSTKYTLSAGGLLSYTTGSFKSTCYGTTCKYLSNTSAPTLSEWTLSGSTVLKDGSALALDGFKFSASGEACGTTKPSGSSSGQALPPPPPR